MTIPDCNICHGTGRKPGRENGQDRGGYCLCTFGSARYWDDVAQEAQAKKAEAERRANVSRPRSNDEDSEDIDGESD